VLQLAIQQKDIKVVKSLLKEGVTGGPEGLKQAQKANRKGQMDGVIAVFTELGIK
jgi:hypothetical protein